MKKRLLITVIVMILVMTMIAGCGQSKVPATDSKGDQTTSGSDKTGDRGSTKYLTGIELFKQGVSDYQYDYGQVKKWDNKLTVTFGRPMDLNAQEFQKMAEAGEPIENSRWIQYFREALNIECVYELTNPIQADYEQQLILGMSSNDLPDIFLVFTQSLINQMAEAGIIHDLTNIYQANVNRTLGDLIEAEGTEIYGTAMVDGKLYAIPQKMPSTNSYNHCWVRRDWLEKFGLDLPKTMDDVKNIAKIFKENLPDNIGLMFSNSYLYEYPGIFWAFGGQQNSSRNQWIEKGGKLVFAEIQPEMKGGLKWIRDMYASGLINPEWATEDTWAALKNYVATNRCGIFYGPHWYGFSLQAYEQSDSMDETADWIACGLPVGIPDLDIQIPANNVIDGWICVNSDFKTPEVAVHLLNAYTEKLFGKNNEFAKYFASDLNSMMWKASPIWSLSATVDLDPCDIMMKAWDSKTKTMDESKLYGSGLTYWNYIKEGQSAYNYMFGPQDSAFVFVKKTYPQALLWNKHLTGPTKTQVERWSSMQELIDTYFLKMINGEIDIDTGFDQMVAEWSKLGGDQVTREINEIYDQFK